MKPLHYAKQIAYSSKEVLMFTYEMSKRFKDSPGVYVECGCAAGAQIIAMAYGAPNKTIYAFDSFEGIPLPSNRDDQMPGIAKLSAWEQKALPDPGKQVLETTGATSVTIESFLEHMDNSGIDKTMVHPVKGWFEDTMPKIGEWMHFEAMDGISILRLDGDLYNSTFVCLQHLYPRTLEHSVVIIDDWSLPGCQAACREYFDLIGHSPDYKFLDGTAYFFK